MKGMLLLTRTTENDGQGVDMKLVVKVHDTCVSVILSVYQTGRINKPNSANHFTGV